MSPGDLLNIQIFKPYHTTPEYETEGRLWGGGDLSVNKSPGDYHSQVRDPLVWCQSCEPNATFANKMCVCVCFSSFRNI